MSRLPDILRYSSDSEPGIIRKVSGKAFRYTFRDGKMVTDGSTLDRIAKLGVLPAYSDVWICRDEFGHLQATGRDEAGRKQYRYHPKWREYRDCKKFSNLCAFADELPRIRDRVARNLRRDGTGHKFCCAAVVRMIDRGALRVGGDSETSYGATTLRMRHFQAEDGALRLCYRAKGGKRVQKTLKDKTLNRAMERISDLPGHTLFQYLDSAGQARPIRSEHVNDYLGDSFTAKTFRTWHGTLAAFETALKLGESASIKALSEAAARRLHNTPAICRSSYIHPKVIDLAGTHISKHILKPPPRRGLKLSERRLKYFLCGTNTP